MASRLQLHSELCKILGSNNCYFQPPESKKLVYPCFVYTLDGNHVSNADDQPYILLDRYQITYLDKNPEPNKDIIHTMIKNFKYCRYTNRFYTSGLNHDIFTLYY